MLQIVLMVFLLLPILAALPVWPYSSDWGYGPSGGWPSVCFSCAFLLGFDGGMSDGRRFSVRRLRRFCIASSRGCLQCVLVVFAR